MEGSWQTTRRNLLLAICLLGVFTLSPAPVQAQEAADQGALPETTSTDSPPNADLLRTGVDDTQLKTGEFIWLPAAERASGVPLTIIVSLSGQRAYVYRDGELIAITTVSTGRPGRETPTGIFEILAKERMHHSNIYDDAPMPFMQRLTWTGLSLHAGHLPGYPASHGCIRLPPKFAEQLFGLTEPGETVVITDDGSAEALARAGMETRIDPATGSVTMVRRTVNAVGPAPEPAADSVSQNDSPDTEGAFSFSR